MWLRRVWAARLLAVMACLVFGAEAWATGTPGCVNLNAGTSSAPPAFSDILICVFDTIAPYANIATLLSILVPVVLVVWGAVAGFRVLRSMFKKGTSAVARA